ncbi:hypothetical protein ACFLT2_04655 [Acidobacteriota bacterium]
MVKKLRSRQAIFIQPAAVALFIAFFTILFQTIKAALANPIDSLRYG